jgi:hypothetical protein
MATSNPVFKRLFYIIFILLTLFLVGSSIYSILPLFTKSYIIKEKDLIKLGTFSVGSRAYFHEGGPRSGSSFIEINAVGNQSFHLGHEQLRSVTDQQQLKDTLLYANTNFVVYTDKEGQERYLTSNRPVISIYQLEIGNKKYVDLDKANKMTRTSLIARAILYGSIYATVLFVFLRKWSTYH